MDEVQNQPIVEDIPKLLKDIRELIWKPWIKATYLSEDVDFRIVLASLDTLEDAQCAIDSFASFPAPEKKPEALYLPIYGLFQAMYMQQDAADSLVKKLNIPTVCFGSKDRHFMVRELRDNLEHPTNRDRNTNGKVCQVFLERHSLTKKTLRYLFAGRDASQFGEFKEVNIDEMIAMQRNALIDALCAVEKPLQERLALHCKTCLQTKLTDLISNGDYYCQKLPGQDVYQRTAALSGLLDLLSRYEQEIERRYGKLKDECGLNEARQIRDLATLVATDALPDQVKYYLYEHIGCKWDSLGQVARDSDETFAKDAGAAGPDGNQTKTV